MVVRQKYVLPPVYLAGYGEGIEVNLNNYFDWEEGDVLRFRADQDRSFFPFMGEHLGLESESLGTMAALWAHPRSQAHRVGEVSNPSAQDFNYADVPFLGSAVDIDRQLGSNEVPAIAFFNGILGVGALVAMGFPLATATGMIAAGAGSAVIAPGVGALATGMSWHLAAAGAGSFALNVGVQATASLTAGQILGAVLPGVGIGILIAINVPQQLRQIAANTAIRTGLIDGMDVRFNGSRPTQELPSTTFKNPSWLITLPAPGRRALLTYESGSNMWSNLRRWGTVGSLTTEYIAIEGGRRADTLVTNRSIWVAHSVPVALTTVTRTATRTVTAGQKGVLLGGLTSLFPTLAAGDNQDSFDRVFLTATGPSATATTSVLQGARGRIDGNRILFDAGPNPGTLNLTVRRLERSRGLPQLIESQVISDPIPITVRPAAIVVPPPTVPEVPTVPDPTDEEATDITRIKHFDNRVIPWNESRTYRLSEYFNLPDSPGLRATTTVAWSRLNVTGVAGSPTDQRTSSLNAAASLTVDFGTRAQLIAARPAAGYTARNNFFVTLDFSATAADGTRTQKRFVSSFTMTMSDPDSFAPEEEAPAPPAALRAVTRRANFTNRAIPWPQSRLYTLSDFFNYDAGEPLTVSTTSPWVRLQLTGSSGTSTRRVSSGLQANSALQVDFSSLAALVNRQPTAGFRASNDFTLTFQFGDERFVQSFSMIAADPISAVGGIPAQRITRFTTRLVTTNLPALFTSKRTDVQTTRAYTATSDTTGITPVVAGNRLEVRVASGEPIPALAAGLRQGRRALSGTVTVTGETFLATGLRKAQTLTAAHTFRVNVPGVDPEPLPTVIDEGGVTYSVRDVSERTGTPDTSDMPWSTRRAFTLSSIYDLSNIDGSTYTISASEPWVDLAVGGGSGGTSSGGVFTGRATDGLTIGVSFDVTQAPSGGFDNDQDFEVNVAFSGYDTAAVNNRATRYRAYTDFFTIKMVVLGDTERIADLPDATFPSAVLAHDYGDADNLFTTQLAALQAVRSYDVRLAVPPDDDIPDVPPDDVLTAARARRTAAGSTLTEAIRWVYGQRLSTIGVIVETDGTVLITTGSQSALALARIEAVDTSAPVFSPALSESDRSSFIIRVDSAATVVRPDPTPQVPTPTPTRGSVTQLRAPDNSPMLWHASRTFPIHELYRYFVDRPTANPNRTQWLHISVVGAPWVQFSWPGSRRGESRDAAGVTRLSWQRQLTAETENAVLSFSQVPPLGGFESTNDFTLVLSFTGTGSTFTVPITMIILNELAQSVNFRDLLLATDTTDYVVGQPSAAFTPASLPTRESRAFAVTSSDPGVTARIDSLTDRLMVSTGSAPASARLTLTATATSSPAFATPIVATAQQEFGVSSTAEPPLEAGTHDPICLRSHDTVAVDVSQAFVNTRGFRLSNVDTVRGVQPIEFSTDLAALETADRLRWEADGSVVTFHTTHLDGYTTGTVTVTGSTGIGGDVSVDIEFSVLSSNSIVAIGGLTATVAGRTATVTPVAVQHPPTPTLPIEYQIQVRSESSRDNYAEVKRLSTVPATFELPEGYTDWTAEACLFWDCFASPIASTVFGAPSAVQGGFRADSSGAITLEFAASGSPITAADVTSLDVRVTGDGYQASFSPLAEAAPDGSIRTTLLLPAGGVYRLDMTAVVAGVTVSDSQTLEIAGPPRTSARGIRATLAGEDVTRQVTTLSFDHGRTDSSGLLRLAAGRADFRMATQLGTADLRGQPVAISYGDSQMFFGTVSDAKISQDNPRTASITVYGVYNELSKRSVDYATRGAVTQADALRQIIEEAGFRFHATRAGVLLPPLRLVGNLLAAVQEVMKYGGVFLEDPYGGFQFGHDDGTYLDLRRGLGSANPITLVATKTTPLERRHANVYNAAFGVSAITLREQDDPVTTDDRAGVRGRLGFDYYYGFDVTQRRGSATLVRRGTTADVTGDQPLTAYAYRDVDWPVNTDVDLSTFEEAASSVPLATVPLARIGDDSTRRVLRAIIAESQEQELLAVGLSAPTASDRFAEMHRFRPGRYVVVDGEQRVIERSKAVLSAGELAVVLQANRNLYDSGPFILDISQLGGGGLLGAGEAPPYPRFILDVSQLDDPNVFI